MTSIAEIRCRFRELGAVFLVCLLLGGVARADEKSPAADLPGRVETRQQDTLSWRKTMKKGSPRPT